MTCPLYGTPLGDSRSGVPAAAVTPLGVQPKEVILATKLLALHMAVNAAIVFSMLSKAGFGVVFDNQGRQVGT